MYLCVFVCVGYVVYVFLSVCVLGECLVFSFHWGGTEKNTTNMSVAHVFVFGRFRCALRWGSVG